jgi:four helix bundle protein
MAGGFEELVVWQKAHALMLFVHREIIPRLPREEKWDLADQIRRSSKSTPSNISEGYGRYYFKDRVRFCYNARGSLCETENHLIAAKDLEYIPTDQYQTGRAMASEVHRLLNGYIEHLKARRPGHDEPGHDICIARSVPDSLDTQPEDF